MKRFLQSPIIRWAGFAMRLFHVRFRDTGVMAHHVQRAVPEQRLQRENVAARTQIGNGERVSKLVGIGFLHPRSVPQTRNQDAQTVLGERPIRGADEEGRLEVLTIFTLREITPDCFSGDFTQVDRASFATFSAAFQSMADGDTSGFHVDVIDSQSAQLGSAQACIQQGQDDSLIAIGAWPAHHELVAILGLGLARIQACLHDLFDFFFGKGFDRMLLKPRGCNVFRGTGKVEFLMEPGEERPEGDPDIADGFCRQGRLAPIEANGLVLGPQPGHVIGQVRGGHVRHWAVTGEGQPMIEDVLIGDDRGNA